MPSPPEDPLPEGPSSLGQRVLAGTLRALLRGLFRPLVRPPLPVGFWRTWTRTLSLLTVAPRGVARTQATVGGVRCEVHTPSDPNAPSQRSAPTLLYLHGGGYCFGSPATHRALAAHLAWHTGGIVVVPDYRRAPEYPFPAALDDALAVTEALLQGGAGFEGVTHRRLVLAGDSAGGGLALATALRLRDAGAPMPAALVAFSPWVDLGARHPDPPRPDAMLGPAVLHAAARHYAGRTPLDHAFVSPLYADLAGLPPLLVQVGTDERLRPDSEALAERARAAGVAVTLEVYAGCWHVFQTHAGVLHRADEALRSAARFVTARAA